MTSRRMIVSGILLLGLTLLGISSAEAQRGIRTRTAGGLIGLAARYPVAKEIGIAENAETMEQIRKWAGAMIDEINEVYAQEFKDQDERAAAVTKVRDKFKPDLKKLLKAEQFTRLQQIDWHLHGLARAIEDPDLATPLELTDEQQKKIAGLISEHRKSLIGEERINKPQKTDVQVLNQQLQIINQHRMAQAKKLDKDIEDVLTSAQQKKLAELKGQPFDPSLLRNTGDSVNGK